jgi:hypothetical protein
MRRTALLAAALAAMLAACGSDEGPAGPGTEPEASTLTAAPSGTMNQVSLSWTRCDDSDFDEYTLYRSLTSGIAANPSAATVVTVITSADDTTFVNTGLEWDTPYYFALLTSDEEGLDSWSNEVMAATPDSGCGGQYLTCHDIQGEASSSPYEGQVVTVMGIVTAGGDEYYSSTSPYAVISDPSGGAWSGLVLFGDSVAGLARGDSIAVTGTVSEYYTLTELAYITSIEHLGTGADLPDPVSIETADMSGGGTSEQWEGVLVTVGGAVVTSVEPYYEFYVDDGSGECMIGSIGDYGYNPATGDTLVSCTGVGWFSYDEYKIQPRDDGDIEVGGGGGPGDVLSCYEVQGQADQSPYLDQIVSVTGIVTVGGDEYYAATQAYAVIQDADGGPWTGLVLFDSDIAGLARGDSVTVTGEVQEYYGLTELSYITEVDIHGIGHDLPPAEPLSTGELSTAEDPELWEAVLVVVSDVTVEDDALGYGEWSVTDGGSACRVDDLGDYSYVPETGDTLQSITGVLFYSFSDFKIEPRDDADLVL